jgi:hypothetical protein
MSQTKILQATIESAKRERETNWKLLLDKVQKSSTNSSIIKRNSIATTTANVAFSNINISTHSISSGGVKRKLITTVNLNDYNSNKNEQHQSENVG